jgi:hypothetical protein
LDEAIEGKDHGRDGGRIPDQAGIARIAQAICETPDGPIIGIEGQEGPRQAPRRGTGHNPAFQPIKAGVHSVVYLFSVQGEQGGGRGIEV